MKVTKDEWYILFKNDAKAKGFYWPFEDIDDDEKERLEELVKENTREQVLKTLKVRERVERQGSEYFTDDLQPRVERLERVIERMER